MGAKTGSECARRRLSTVVLTVGVALTLGLLAGCPLPPDDGATAIYNNTTDRTNDGATYVGSAACMACHSDIAANHSLHAHGNALKGIQDGTPTYPNDATWAGGFDPPDGKQWTDVAYVIGGHLRKAKFVDTDGFVMTDGVEGVNTQWNLAFPDNEATAGWTVHLADQVDPPPYDYDCFVCHVTGAVESDPGDPVFQDNRPGMSGTFVELGVQCEVCHGPGSNHAPNPGARDLFVDTVSTTCRECHITSYKSEDTTLLASDGYIIEAQQWVELQASGGHAGFSCLYCHDPHVSANYDTENAIINDCDSCHADYDMAFHEGVVFVRGDYVEVMNCRSCHMPYATRAATAAAAAVVGDDGWMGDTRTHVFRIDTDEVDYETMFSADGSEVALDTLGQAAVTVDFVCLRCHNGLGNAYEFTVREASSIARSSHAN